MARLKLSIARPAKKLIDRGQEIKLTPNERGQYEKVSGRFAKERLERLMSSQVYKKATDEQRQDLIRDAFRLARRRARAKIIPAQHQKRKGRKQTEIAELPTGFVIDR